METTMNQALNKTKLSPEFRPQPIKLIDVISKDVDCNQGKSFFSKFFDSIFERSDLTLEQWQRLESKPRLNPSSDYTKYFYGRGL